MPINYALNEVAGAGAPKGNGDASSMMIWVSMNSCRGWCAERQWRRLPSPGSFWVWKPLQGLVRRKAMETRRCGRG